MTIQRRNNVHVVGEGPVTMMFAHGFGCDQNMWRLLAPHFQKRFRTVLFDLVGSGCSDLSAFDKQKYATLQGHADDVVDIMREFGQGPTVFVGHSVSAMIGAIAEVDHPDLFLAHAMIGPSPCYLNDGAYKGGFDQADIDGLLETLESNYLGWSSNMAPAIMGAPNGPELGEELTNSFCRTDPEIAKHFARTTFTSDHRNLLPKLRAPTLVIQCDDDLIAPVSVGEYMSTAIPNCVLEIIENVGHCPHLSAASACSTAIDRFLASRGL